MTESVDVIERYQINFAWQQTGSPVHSRDSGIVTASCKLAQTMDVFLGLIENGLTECAHIAQEMKKAIDAGKIIKVKREYMLAEGEKAKK